MTYTQTQYGYIVCIHAGEEIMDTLLSFVRNHDLSGTTFTGLGAVRKADVGMYNMNTHAYEYTHLPNPHEIANLTGNTARHDDDIHLHVHITLANKKQQAFGGHLKQAVAEPTCEIHIIDHEVPFTRTHDAYSQLPLLNL